MHYHQCQTEKLEDSNNLIMTIVVDLMAAQYKPNDRVTQWNIQKTCTVFQMKHDELMFVSSWKYPLWTIYFLVCLFLVGIVSLS